MVGGLQKSPTTARPANYLAGCWRFRAAPMAHVAPAAGLPQAAAQPLLDLAQPAAEQQRAVARREEQKEEQRAEVFALLQLSSAVPAPGLPLLAPVTVVVVLAVELANVCSPQAALDSRIGS